MKTSTIVRLGALALVVVLCITTFILVNQQVSAHGSAPAPSASPAKSVVALPNYDVSIFAQGNKTYYNPDSVDVAGKYIFIGYQNTTAKDGTDHKTSTIVQYTRQGNVVRTFSVPGHCDGMRYNSTTHLLWATSNEDGNPNIATIDPANGKVTSYQVPATPHGGGYDDVIFIKGQAFIAASNPTLNSAGINVFPAIDKVELKNGKAIFTPVLYGNATATDVTTNQSVSLNLTDPDSMTLDNQGNLVLADQADAQLITIHNPGMAKQAVTRLPVGTQVDDSIWIPAKEGKLLVIDGKANTIYTVTIDKTDFAKGTIFTEAPYDSGVAGFVGKVDPKTGTTTPVIIGLNSPTGLMFLPAEGE